MDNQVEITEVFEINETTVPVDLVDSYRLTPTIEIEDTLKPQQLPTLIPLINKT